MTKPTAPTQIQDLLDLISKSEESAQVVMQKLTEGFIANQQNSAKNDAPHRVLEQYPHLFSAALKMSVINPKALTVLAGCENGRNLLISEAFLSSLTTIQLSALSEAVDNTSAQLFESSLARSFMIEILKGEITTAQKNRPSADLGAVEQAVSAAAASLGKK